MGREEKRNANEALFVTSAVGLLVYGAVFSGTLPPAKAQTHTQPSSTKRGSTRLQAVGCIFPMAQRNFGVCSLSFLFLLHSLVARWKTVFTCGTVQALPERHQAAPADSVHTTLSSRWGLGALLFLTRTHLHSHNTPPLAFCVSHVPFRWVWGSCGAPHTSTHVHSLSLTATLSIASAATPCSGKANSLAAHKLRTSTVSLLLCYHRRL